MEEHQNDLAHVKAPREHLRLFFTGFAMGSADIVPGVSGGTMAFILGVYEALINGIRAVNLDVIRLILQFKIRAAFDLVPWRFLLALGYGVLAAVFTLARVLSALLAEHPAFVFSFFFGLIVASIVVIGAKVKWTPGMILAMVLGAVAAYWIVGMVEPESVPHDPLTLSFTGALAIMAMILPGISGSFILLILGQYHHVLDAVKSLDVVTILAVATGAAAGLAGFSRLLSWLLKHYHQTTIAVLVGFMIGSLRRVWQEIIDGVEKVPDFAAQEFFLAVILGTTGFVVVSLVDHIQSGANPLFRLVWSPRPRREIAGAD